MQKCTGLNKRVSVHWAWLVLGLVTICEFQSFSTILIFSQAPRLTQPGLNKRVSVHWAWLVLGLVTICEFQSFSTILIFSQTPRLTQPGHPSGVCKMSTNKSWGVNRHSDW